MSSEMYEKLIELVRKCDELYDISHKKYSDSVWKEILCGKIGEEYHIRFFLSLRVAFFSSSSNVNAIAANCLLENE